jgi:gamma-glutamylaminecyclotransferase
MRLFIYGTLKRGCFNHFYMHGQRFIDTARTAPLYRLYNLGGYPGMVLDEQGLSIEGEVWEIDESCRTQLDVLEGVDEGEYVLEPVPLLQPCDGEVVQGYRYLRSVEGRPEVGTEWTERKL